MLDPAASPRLRFGSTKVRTGCMTCKARRVKCDESKPSCQRCIKAHRQCGGYAKGRLKAANFVHYTPGTNRNIDGLPDLDATEKRALWVFQQHVAPELATQFCTDLYSRHILFVAAHEEVVRDSVIALSALYEQSITVLHTAHSDILEFALEHYGRAISSMIRLNIKDAASSTDVALLGCLVFGSLEVLQGHYKSALTHFTSGLKLLGECESGSASSSGVYVPRLLFRQAFIRVQTQCLELGLLSAKDCVPRLDTWTRPSPAVHVSFSQAVVSMSAKYSRLLMFLQNEDAAVIRLNMTQKQVDAVREKRSQITNDYVAWCYAFHKMSPHPEDKIEDVAICELYKTFMGIMLRIDLNQGQIAFDAFEKEFQDVVLLASIFLSRVSSILTKSEARRKNAELSVKMMAAQNEALGMHRKSGNFMGGIKAGATPICPGPLPDIPPSKLQRPAMPILPQPGSFFKPTFVSVGLGIIQPLFSVCVRCRNTSIRRQALNLLRMSNRKEGMWDSMIASTVGEVIVDSEISSVPGLTDDSPASAIPEHARIQEIHADLLDPKRGVLHVMRSTDCKCSACMSGPKDHVSPTTDQSVDW